MQLEISIGTNKSFISYNSETEKESFVSVSRELNKEYNKLLIDCGKIDETILLFFLLIKTEIKLRKIDYKKSDDLLLLVLRSISKYIQDKDTIKTKESLVVINMIRKIELEKKINSNIQEEDQNITLIKNFIQDIRSNIEAIENNILLS